MKRFSFLLFAASLVAAFSFTACSDDDDPDTNTGTANVMVVHGVADAPNVDVLFNDAVTGLTNVPYNNTIAAGGYTAVDAVTGLKIGIAATGTTTPVAELSGVDLADGQNYTVIAHGSLAGNSVALSAVGDDLTAPASGNAAIRVGHYSFDAPAVDVLLLTNTGDTVGTNLNAATSNLAYPSMTGFLEVPGGDYVLALGAAGSTDVVFEIGAVNLTAGKKYTAVAQGSFALGSFTVRLIENN